MGSRRQKATEYSEVAGLPEGWLASECEARTRASQTEGKKPSGEKKTGSLKLKERL
jgi:hypothetical protein